MRYLLAAAMLVLASVRPAPAMPQRIVSINVCTDQLLMALVEPERIASVSFLAADPATSVRWRQAAALHLNHGRAEEIMALQPDLVVAGTYAARVTASILKKLGYTLLELRPAASIQDIRDNLLTLGQATGSLNQARKLIDVFDQRLERLRYPAEGTRKLFVNYALNGWTSGTGTLVADLAHHAGFDVAGDRLGFQGLGNVSLERLILLSPDLIDLGNDWADPPSLASQSQGHPALQSLLQRTAQVSVDEPLWSCGTPWTLDALAQLRQARDALE